MIDVTDEQLRETAYLHFNGNKEFSKSYINELFNSLTKEQRIALVEEIGLGVFEWVEFDAEDESTWPELSSEEIVCEEFLVYETLNNSVNHDYFKDDDEWNHYPNYVTHWCELPKPPKEK